MAKIAPIRPIIRSVSSSVQIESNREGVFIAKAKTEKIICCGLVKKRTALMLVVAFFVFGLVAIFGVGFSLAGRI